MQAIVVGITQWLQGSVSLSVLPSTWPSREEGQATR